MPSKGGTGGSAPFQKIAIEIFTLSFLGKQSTVIINKTFIYQYMFVHTLAIQAIGFCCILLIYIFLNTIFDIIYSWHVVSIFLIEFSFP